MSIDLVPAMHLAGLPTGSRGNLHFIPARDAEFIRKAGCDVIPKEYQGGEWVGMRPLVVECL